MEHRANWIFRMTEDASTRCDQLRAVNGIVTGWVVGVPVAAASPLLWLAFGARSMIAAGVVALVGLVFVNAVLLGWRRIPFTCSYLPGKRLIAHTLVLGFAAFVLFTAGGVLLVHLALASTAAGIVIAFALCVIAWLLYRRRLAQWREIPLMFEDELPDQPLQLGL
jgi:divalent metal cation (Fe/Co/Zn/Cd) transporter